MLSLALQAVADASGHLPTYEAQQLHACMKSLKEELTQLRAQSAPKKRFSFARKPAPAPAAPDAAPGAGKGGSLQPSADLPSAASLAAEPSSAPGLCGESHLSGGKGCAEPERGSKSVASSTTQTARRTDDSPAVSSRCAVTLTRHISSQLHYLPVLGWKTLAFLAQVLMSRVRGQAMSGRAKIP